ncbi:hypothetical protein BDA99DRAFT_606880 [Phascolomyces articulosus]|uniref:F-box domain-containing protein n=1 Tax=Phascolomyces articulosus TaxID=60185 RepID=A0AAD5JVG0_9FUNG|nr:hypothetical protein BDA99DRAFT_606880 [Phascolomyces articulosus]
MTIPGKRKQEQQLESPSKCHLNNDDRNTMTFIDSTTTNDGWNEFSITAAAAANALDSTSFDKAIEHSSTAIQLLRNQFINMLEIRASAWAEIGNRVKELEDALMMIDIAPNYSAGYRRTGLLYTALGYHEHAIQILEKGLSHVSHQDNQYLRLKQQFENAQLQLERRIDFLTSCPHEIVSSIMDQLSLKDLYECIWVSRRWYQIIIQNHPCWRNFSVVDNDNDPCTLKLLPMIYPNIQKFLLTGAEDFLKKQLTFIQTHEFSCLQSLEIHTQGLFPYRRIPNIFSNIGNTLTNLSCQGTGIEQMASLAFIVSTCQNLSVIQIIERTEMRHPWFLGLSSLSQITKLTRIVLYFEDITDETDFLVTKELNALIRHSPALEYINFNGCDAYVLLQTIELHCPKIKKLCLNMSRFDDKYNVEDGFFGCQEEEEQDTVESNGSSTCCGGCLNYLVLCGIFPADGSVILRLLEKNRDSLRTLVLSPRITISSWQQNTGRWKVLSTLNSIMTALKTLSIRQLVPDNPYYIGIEYEAVTHLIHQSPKLSHLALSEFDDEEGIPNDMMDGIARLQYLEYLQLDHSGVPIQTNLCRQRAVVARNFFPSLTELKIINCKGLTNTLLECLARIQTLKIVSIQFLWREPHLNHPLVQFMQLLARLPCLNELHLCRIQLDDDMIHPLGESKSLQEFRTTLVISRETKEYLRKKGIQASLRPVW